MKRICLYILIVLAVLLSTCSCNRSKGIIPRGKMSKIYAELFVADAWLGMASSELKHKADTTAFYEPIFKKYGYTTKDYLNSVEYYLNDPERFARILKKTKHMLDVEVAQLEGKKVEDLEDAQSEEESE